MRHRVDQVAALSWRDKRRAEQGYPTAEGFSLRAKTAKRAKRRQSRRDTRRTLRGIRP